MRIFYNKSFLTATFVILLAVAVFTSVKLVNVEATDAGEMYKYYTSYEIQPGDTLISIAEKYSVNGNISVRDYISEVKRDNYLKSDRIISGNHLIISYYSDEKK